MEGNARLGDFGITGVVTASTLVGPGAATPLPGKNRYIAPELLDPAKFELPNGNSTKESDVYSLAMTAYEVCSPTPCVFFADVTILPMGPHGDSTIWER